MARKTLSLIEDESLGESQPVGPYLVLGFDCRRPLVGSSRVSLADVESVVVGRGPYGVRAVRSTVRNRRQLQLDTEDDWMSAEHFRLNAAGDGWALIDAGSKNGTRVNGRKRSSSRLTDGDVIEAATTWFVFRENAPIAPDQLEAAPPDPDEPGLVTLSTALEAEYDRISRVAASRVPVILYGASGTGKEVVARAIHRLSERSGRFVALNSGALAESLVEAELFGTVKGAFSGAVESREGLVRSAHGGTLFLDEIAELPESSQTKLLRVLEQREVLPVGSSLPVPVDLRVVAATHTHLPDRISAGRFRGDLYARLRGFELWLPPLSHRREDLGLLIGSLLHRIAGEHAAQMTLKPRAARALFAHDWPLNIRELYQALAAAVAVADDDEIALDHLPRELLGRPRRAVSEPGRATGGTRSIGSDELRAALAEHGGNVSAVARALQTSRSHVRRLARRMDIDLDAFRDG